MNNIKIKEMKKIALIYSFNTKKTTKVAEKIAKHFEKEQIELVNAEDITEEKFLSFENFIIGSATWFDGELPNHWDEFVPAIKSFNVKGKTFALFGLGDQNGYPENFGDAIGILADLFEERGGKIIGFTSVDGYSFESSAARRENQFTGLMIDFENQNKLTDSRIKSWVTDIKKSFK